jgi:hypothetical protein
MWSNFLKLKFIQFALKVAILECYFLKHSQRIVGVNQNLVSRNFRG